MSDPKDPKEPKDPWYREFFQGLALEFWRQAHSPEQSAAEASFIEEMLCVEPSDSILDVPCGNGRLALELAARGYRLSGIDQSAEFIEEARQTAANQKWDIEYNVGEMGSLPWKNHFSGAFCFGNSFGYLEAASTLDFLQAVGQALKPKGRFVLDTLVAAESILPEIEDRVWMPVGDMFLLTENHYNPELSRLDTDYTFVQGSRREHRSAQHWVFTVGEINRMLSQAGFHTVAQFENLEGEPFQFGSPRLLLIAEKK